MVIAKERIEYSALVAEIVAALGVIISVVYLAIQVGDSNNELRAQTHYNANIMVNRTLELLVSDEGLAEIVTKAAESKSGLSKAEWERFTQYELMIFNGWEYSYYLNESSSIPPQLWIGQDSYMNEQVRTRPGLKTFWDEYQHAYAEPFRSYVESQFQ